MERRESVSVSCSRRLWSRSSSADAVAVVVDVDAGAFDEGNSSEDVVVLVVFKVFEAAAGFRERRVEVRSKEASLRRSRGACEAELGSDKKPLAVGASDSSSSPSRSSSLSSTSSSSS